MTVQAIDENSPHLDSVKSLWREHSKTLGFLPDGAFHDYAQERRVLVALDGGQCVGYLLYRVVRDKAAVAHFCVAKSARRRGHGKALMRHLSSITKHLRGIILSCRRDYEANDTWRRLGFQVVGEVPGRAANGSELTRWFLDHGHADLFSVDDDSTIQAAIDANIFLDLVKQRRPESLGLQADWLRPYVTLCYTAELLNEINQSEDSATRKKQAGEAQQFKALRCCPESYDAAEALLRPIFPTFKTNQDEGDFRHLVRALACDADVFVTADEGILDRADDIYAVCQLPVVRPAELIGQIDQLQREREYQRSYVSGTRHVSLDRINCPDDSIVDAIYRQGDERRKLISDINRYLSEPHRFRCHKLVGEGELWAFYVVETDGDIDRVPILRVCAKRKQATITRAVLTGIVREAVKAGRKAVHLLDEIDSAACVDLGFIPAVQGGRAKLIYRGWLSIDEAIALVPDPLKASLPAARTDPVIASQVEHLIWPAKLSDAPIQSFIVPIKPQFAEHLFDYRLAEGGVFGTDVDLALNHESAYYRAGKSAIVASPGRVLWYVSESDKYKGTKAIRACSRIVEVVRDTPKILFPRFRRLGVYEWRHVRETADGDLSKVITAFRFDDSELLRPIPWDDFQSILQQHGNGSPLVGPVQISTEAFGAIYAATVDSPQVR